MTAVAASAVALALSYAGMAGLSLAMDRHDEQVMGHSEVPPAWRRMLRATSGVVLALALLACTGAWGATVGFTAWWGFLTAGGVLVAWLMAYRPRQAAAGAGVALVFGLAGWLATAAWG